MTISTLLEELAQQNIRLSADADQLRIQAPKGVLTPTIQTTLKERKAEILDWLTAQNGVWEDLPAFLPDEKRRFEPFPLTDIQNAFWVGESKGMVLRNTYHIYFEYECRQLDVNRLNCAWQRLVAHHEMLRAVVSPTGEQQILENVPTYSIAVTDLSQLAATAQATQLGEISRELSHQAFTLTEWPLFDIRVTRLNEDISRLHISLALILLDGGSTFSLLQQWDHLYRNPEAPLTPLTISYRDYVLWKAKITETASYQRAKQYWINRLDTLHPAPQLPLITVEAEDHAQFTWRRHTIDATAWQRLKTELEAKGVTPSAFLLTLFARILATWGQEAKFTLNLTMFDRPAIHPEMDSLLGDFSTITLLTIDETASRSLLEAARQIQQQLWQDQEHNAFSGVQVIRELARKQNQVGEALMPVVFTSFLPLSARSDSPFVYQPQLFAGNAVHMITQTPQVLLDHMVMEEEGSLVLIWDTVDGCFPPSVLDEMFEAYCRLVERFTMNQAVWHESHLSLLPIQQQEKLVAVNDTAAPLSDDLLHTLFLKQAIANPTRPAVITAQQTMTYADLLHRATAVAQQLRMQGTEPNTLVAVVMNKGWEQVVGVLGALLAGAAYLPIDPDLPQERLWYLLENGEVQTVLSQSWLNVLVLPPGVARLDVDRQPLMPTEHNGTDSLSRYAEQSPDDLACVIYTSGSTGLPKGAMLTHRGIVNAILATNQTYQVGPKDSILALTPLIHDMSMYDLFGLLAAGGSIIIPDAEKRRDTAHWAELLTHHGITLWNSVPAMMEMLLVYAAEIPTLKLSRLRLTFLGGDWIGLTIPERLQQLAPHAQLVSVGGPTETTLWNIWYPLKTVDPQWKSIPYGHPLPNTRYYILNERLEPCPIGVIGQMYVAGVGVAAGYWRDATRTAEKFITHPLTGERIYATGDLGCYRPDGEIEFVGRHDFQVKLRGRRIELSEVEFYLQHAPSVREAVVTTTGSGENKQLVAYIVPSSETATGAGIDLAVDNLLPAGAVIDPAARTAFKLQKVGFRPTAPEAPRIALDVPTDSVARLAAYTARQSYRTFDRQPLTSTHLSGLLSCLAPIQPEESPLPKYLYGSAGGLYPVQTYLHVKPNRIEGIPGGMYYYHPSNHELILLEKDVQLDLEAHAPRNRAISDEAAFTIFLVGKLSAIAPMYGELARDFCLMEVGYMSQLLMMQAPQHQIGFCPIGIVAKEKITPFLQIDPKDHLLLHTLIGGRITDEQTKHIPLMPIMDKQHSFAEDLRRYLQTKLPAYMVPTQYIPLDALPLTANGKVDRKALPAFKATGFPTAQETRAPATAIEELLAANLKELLQLEQVSTTSNFFELGANSVHMVQLYNRLSKTLNGTFSVVDLFKHPTIQELAQYLGQANANGTTTTPVPTGSRGAARRLARQQTYSSRPNRRE